MQRQDSSIRLSKEAFTLVHFTRKMDGESARHCAKNTRNTKMMRIRDHMPQLMHINRVVQCKWKQFIYHMGRARDRYSIAEAGLGAGGKENKEAWQTIFFTPLDPYHSDASEAESSTDFSKPRKVHYQTHWRPEQDAVYWINLSRAQDCGLKFWQTQSHLIIVYQSRECVEKVVTEQGSRQLFSGQLTPRKGPKVTLRDTWVQ